MQTQDPKTLFSILKLLSHHSKKSFIATSFNQTSLDANQLPSDYSFQTYIQEQFATPQEHRFSPLAPSELLTASHHTPFTKEDVDAAVGSLKNKAIGLDMLSARLLKLPCVRAKVVPKITAAFNDWQEHATCPHYLKSAKIIPLSKQNTEYPDVGQIRLIAILPAISKVYEKCILRRLDDEITALGGLHPSQTGFTKGKSTLHNIDAMSIIVKKAREVARAERTREKKPELRRRQYICLFDFTKAFDSLLKPILKTALCALGVSPSTVQTIQVLLTGTNGAINDQEVQFLKGIP